MSSAVSLRCPHQGLPAMLHWAGPARPCYTTIAYMDNGRNCPSHPIWWNWCKFDAETPIVADRHGDSWAQPITELLTLKSILQLLNLIHWFSAKPWSHSSTTARVLLFWHARSKNSAELRFRRREFNCQLFFPTLYHFVPCGTPTWGKTRDADGLYVAARSVTWRTHASPPPASRSLQQRCRWGAEGSVSLGTSS